MRNNLAKLRTELANERTVLAYIRTSLSLVVTGLAFIKLFENREYFILGIIIVVLGVLVLIAGFYRFIKCTSVIGKEKC